MEGPEGPRDSGLLAGPLGPIRQMPLLFLREVNDQKNSSAFLLWQRLQPVDSKCHRHPYQNNLRPQANHQELAKEAKSQGKEDGRR
jgi:hypothetical protein